MKDLLNCPNCGAPISGSKCEYCGTVFSEKCDDDLNDLNEKIRLAMINISQYEQMRDILNSIGPLQVLQHLAYNGILSGNDIRQSIQASLNDLNKTQYKNIRDSLNTCHCETIITSSTAYDESGNSMTGSHIWPQTELTFWQKVKNWWNMNGYLFGF